MGLTCWIDARLALESSTVYSVSPAQANYWHPGGERQEVGDSPAVIRQRSSTEAQFLVLFSFVFIINDLKYHLRNRKVLRLLYADNDLKMCIFRYQPECTHDLSVRIECISYFNIIYSPIWMRFIVSYTDFIQGKSTMLTDNKQLVI